MSESRERMTDSLGYSIAQVADEGRVLRVFFVERGKDIIVIAAYKTSKEKYRAP